MPNEKKRGKQMQPKIWCIALVCVSLSQPAIAENIFSTQYNSYISFDAGQSKAPGTCDFLFASGSTCSEKGAVFRLGYGYQFTPTWGTEISYGDFGRASESGILPATPPGVPGSGPIPYTWDWSAIGWELAGTGTLHLGDSLFVTGKLGILRANTGSEIIVTTSTNEIWHAVTHDVSNNISKGISIRYDFNRDFALRLQYTDYGELGEVSKIKTSAINLGLLLKF